MVTDNGAKRENRDFGNGVTVHFIQRPGEEVWRIDWLDCSRLSGNPFDAIGELQSNSRVAMVGPSSAELKSSPIIRAADMGWEAETFATIDKACEFARPRLPRFE